jgi:hypothetical protein
VRTIALYILLPLVPAFGQALRLPASFDKLAAKAREVVDVTLDGAMLQFAGKFLSDRKPDEAKVKNLLSGLKGIYVRSFEFAKEGEYSEADVEAVRSQLRSPGWSRIVGAVSKQERENAEVFLKSEGNQISGIAIIAAEPKELTIVNIVGPIDLAQLSDLGGQFGIPKIEVNPARKAQKGGR